MRGGQILRIAQARTVGLLTLLMVSWFSQAADLASTIRAQLAQPEILRGEFEQVRTVVGFKKPLLSTGDFLVARKQGVLWRTRKPFASELRLTRDEILAKQDGAVAYRLNANKEPAVKVINSLLFSLLNGDLATLEQHFKIDGEASAKQWQLTLLPKGAALAKIMQKVLLQGDQYVRQIEIYENSGDSSRIRFSQQSSEQGLSELEVKRFD